MLLLRVLLPIWALRAVSTIGRERHPTQRQLGTRHSRRGLSTRRVLSHSRILRRNRTRLQKTGLYLSRVRNRIRLRLQSTNSRSLTRPSRRAPNTSRVLNHRRIPRHNRTRLLNTGQRQSRVQRRRQSTSSRSPIRLSRRAPSTSRGLSHSMPSRSLIRSISRNPNPRSRTANSES